MGWNPCVSTTDRYYAKKSGFVKNDTKGHQNLLHYKAMGLRAQSEILNRPSEQNV